MGDKPFAYFLSWPAESSLGQDKFFGADSHRRMQQKIDYAPEGLKPEVVPLYRRDVPKPNIEIVWISDYYDCDQCGGAGADGGIVKIDGEIVVDMTPKAHCYGGTSYSQDQVYAELFKHLGFNVTHSHDYCDD